MSATAPVITLAAFLKLEFPGTTVRLCDGGMLSFAGEEYQAQHPVFGTVNSMGEAEAGFGDLAESGSLVLMPHPQATLSDWWRSDLFGSRMRLWVGEVGPDGYTVTSAKQVFVLLVDSYERRQGDKGSDLLAFEFIGRAEKLFLANEGNVCSSRFHQSVWAGERGFDNATDLQFFVAWGVAGPPRAVGGAGGGGSGGGGGRGPFGGVFDR